MALYAALVVVAAILAISFKFLQRKKRILNGKQIPHQAGLPVLGMGLEFTESNSIYKFEEMAKRYGEIFSLNLYGRNMVVLNTEPLMMKAFCSEKYAQYFSDKPTYCYAKYFRRSGDSVAFIADGHGRLHKQMKKTFMKALYRTGVKQLEDKIMIELDNVINTIDNMKTKEFDFVGFLKKSITNVVALLLIGETMPDGDPDEDLFWHQAETADSFVSHYAECKMSNFPFIRYLTFTTFGKLFQFGMDMNKRIADKFFYPYKKSHQAGDDQGIVNFYLEQQRNEKKAGKEVICTDDRIISTIVETIDGSILTTWTVLTNSMLVLLNHPEYQIKLQDEIDRVIGNGRLPTFNDRTKCPFFLAFEKEIHRYIPVAPLLLPHVCNEDIEFEGYNIEKDTCVIPFGLGERRCAGEIFGKTRFFLYISTLLQQYSFESPDVDTLRSCDPRCSENFDINISMRAKTFNVRAVKR